MAPEIIFSNHSPLTHSQTKMDKKILEEKLFKLTKWTKFQLMTGIKALCSQGVFFQKNSSTHVL
jgi:hypothetical protein